jgi:hypothetical protein
VSALQAQNIREMTPRFGRTLELSPELAEEWGKAAEIMMQAEDMPEPQKAKLMTANKSFFDRIGFDDENFSAADYYGLYGALTEGGSWYAGGGTPDAVTASSHLKSNHQTINYAPENAHDFSLETAWIEGVKGYGTGEYIVYHFSWEHSGAEITEIKIANGYVKTQKAYLENSRVKKLKLYINDQPAAILHLEDRRAVQIFDFEPMQPKTLKFEILEVYKGDKYDDTAISEIFFDGTGVFCFGAGTKILMADNSLKNIELIQEGDFVKSYDFENKQLTDSKVSKLISAVHSDLLKLKFADNEIVVTSDHPFWVERNVWAAIDAEKANNNYVQKTKVESLKVGDKIFVPEKNTFSEIIAIETVAGQQMTYTIELSENENFIANRMLVKTEIKK